MYQFSTLPLESRGLMANDSALASMNVHYKRGGSGRDFVSLWAENLFCIRKIVPFGRDENGAEREGSTNVVGA